ncbi:MAG: uracil-DNA glycosylase family protein [Chloroflexia bacterium]
MGKLDKLDQQVRSCRLCRLCRTRLNGVPGDGNQAAEVMFIGEGPGFNEDREGKPFVGPAGTFLDELLGLAGLLRPDVYITNVVKCRPPQNRDPLPDEIDACAPYLERQIAVIDPLLIVTLGRFSMARFFPNDRISSVHGEARQMDGRVVMTMWHPAYGLRNDDGKQSLREDFRKIPSVIEQARELRAARPAPPSRRPADLSALVERELSVVSGQWSVVSSQGSGVGIPVPVAAEGAAVPVTEAPVAYDTEDEVPVADVAPAEAPANDAEQAPMSTEKPTKAGKKGKPESDFEQLSLFS